ncbi:hypothetical protein [Carboxylicivirga marina]|uniref:hypothetical protein n=1 Tax=Carboxylicivirga marina TaxID=2800988 RepID=UPI002599590D|nr:hypothetical protein [uncultured Carboxylicivirga sp.]
MRENIKLILGVLLIMVTLSGCYDQDVEPVISPDAYPTATFSSDLTGTDVTEGDTVIYTIMFDKMYDYDVTFSAKEISASSDHLYVMEDVTLPKYSNEVEMALVILDDGLPSAVDQNIQLELGAFSVEDRYKLNPSSVNEEVSLTIKNYNDPTLLTVAFDWSTSDDMDIVTWSNTTEYPMTPWGADGATSDQPEVDKSIWLADPAGEYYVSILDWDAGVKFDYTFTIGYPDGQVEIITGTFDGTNTDLYTADEWLASWGSPMAYRILEVNNDGTSFTVNHLN